MSPTTTIPPEIWHYIFRLACVDGGFTGRSLALASTFFHAQSPPTRFHSLAFASLDSMTAFVKFLQQQPPNFQPRVQHLYISVSMDFRDPVVECYEHGGKSGLDAVWSLVGDVLRVAAPTVRTLCVAMCSLPGRLLLPIDLPHNISFPHMEELSWMGPPIFYFDGYETSRSQRPASRWLPGTFPTLKRVHFVSMMFSAQEVIGFLAEIAAASLTHVRISASRDMYAPSAPDVFGRALGARAPSLLEIMIGGRLAGALDASGSSTSVAAGEPSLPRLTCMILHLFQPGRRGCGMPYDHSSRRLLMQLVHLRDACNGRAERLPLLHLVAAQPDQHWPGRLREDWEARMGGAVGCWSTFEPEEDASGDDEEDRWSTTAQPRRMAGT